MSRFRLSLILVPLALSACASTILSDDRIQSNTAAVLGVSAEQVTISGRNGDGLTNTAYLASASGRTYACVINGGTVLSMGIVNPPTCTPR